MSTTTRSPLNTPLNNAKPYSSNNFSLTTTTTLSSPLTITLRVATALRLVSVVMCFSSILSLAIAVSLSLQPLWPLKNISQYAATSPAIYFFRMGTLVSGVLLVGCACSFYQQRHALTKIGMGPCTIFGFFVAGIGLGGAGLISCVENNGVHTTLAFSMFIAQTCIQFGQIEWHACCHTDPDTGATWSLGAVFRAVGAVYLCGCLIVTVLMATAVVPKVDYVISLLEWTGTGELLLWNWWYGGKVSEECVEGVGARDVSVGERRSRVEGGNHSYSFDQVDEL